MSKAGKEYISVILGMPGYEKYSTFLPREFFHDFVPHTTVNVKFDVSFRNWQPQLKIIGVEK